jgi:hypothetical protein
MRRISDSYTERIILTKQVGGNDQHLVNGCNGNSATLPPTELSGLEDSTFKVVRLSPEEKKEKIHRYRKKRNERNFNKKIKVPLGISVEHHLCMDILPI